MHKQMNLYLDTLIKRGSKTKMCGDVTKNKYITQSEYIIHFKLIQLLQI